MKTMPTQRAADQTGVQGQPWMAARTASSATHSRPASGHETRPGSVSSTIPASRLVTPSSQRPPNTKNGTTVSTVWMASTGERCQTSSRRVPGMANSIGSTNSAMTNGIWPCSPVLSASATRATSSAHSTTIAIALACQDAFRPAPARRAVTVMRVPARSRDARVLSRSPSGPGAGERDHGHHYDPRPGGGQTSQHALRLPGVHTASGRRCKHHACLVPAALAWSAATVETGV